MKKPETPEKKQLNDERESALQRFDDWLDPAMVVLGLIWLVLIIVDLIGGLNPFLKLLSNLIWGIFILDLVIEVILAPRRIAYVRKNWLTVVSTVIPALRVFRVARALGVMRYAEVTRTTRLVSVIGSINRGMATLGAVMSRRGFGYVMLLTAIVVFAGAAGMYSFEKNISPAGINDYGTALWWTAMIMTTMGSQYWPVSVEGRMLCLILAIYAFAVFGYVTATIATFFLGIDSGGQSKDQSEMESLRNEISALRDAVGKLAQRHDNGQ